MMPRLSRSFAIVLLALLWPVAAIGGPAAHVPDELLVRFRAGTAPAHGAALHAAAGAVPLRSFTTVRDLHLVKLPRGLSTAQAIARYRTLPEVLYVEPNHVVTLQATPNDPHFLAGDQWGLNAPILTQDIDIDAPEAWDLATGSATVVVAVIDSGIDYTHEDLAANMFRNNADCNANGLDDDGNGFVDDCYGIAPINSNSDPIDDNAHGSHVAGHHRGGRQQRRRGGRGQLERPAPAVQDVQRRRLRDHRRRDRLPGLRGRDEGPRREHRGDQQQLELAGVLAEPPGRDRRPPPAGHPVRRGRRQLRVLPELPDGPRQRPQADLARQLLPAQRHRGGELELVGATSTSPPGTDGARCTSPPPAPTS